MLKLGCVSPISSAIFVRVGGADINTGWRYVECLEKNSFSMCVAKTNAGPCPASGPDAGVNGCGVCLDQRWDAWVGCSVYIQPKCATSSVAVHDQGQTVFVTVRAFLPSRPRFMS